MDTVEGARASVDGRQGWLVVTGAFTANAVGFGILYSFTIFFPAILSEFGGGRGGVSVIASVAAAVMLGSGAVVGRLTDRYGPGKVIGTGSGLLFAGMMLASVSKGIWGVYLSYGLLLGLGVGCAFVPSNAAVGQWFLRRRGLATGIAVAGSGVGSVVLAPISEWLIASYDWRIALRILAAGGLLLLLPVSRMVRGRAGRHRSSVLTAMKADRTFRILYAAAFVASYGYWVPFVHIVPYARDHGLTPASAALLVSVMGLFNIVGRVILGTVADRLGRRRILQVAVVFMALSMFAWPLAQGRFGLMVFAASYGFFAGTFISLLFALTADYFGAERLAGVSGLLNTAAVLGTLIGAPVTGAMFDSLGSYEAALLLAAASMAVAAAVLTLLPSEKRAATPLGTPG